MAEVAATTGARTRARATDAGIAATLLAGALVGWWWAVRMADDATGGSMGSMGGMGEMGSMSMGDSMSMAAYLGGWVAMMAAMMFPAISPVVRLYARAAERGTVAPLPFFVLGYLVMWAAMGLPAYVAWRELAGPLDEGATWVGRLAGAVLVIAAAYQLTPLKRACLRHCRSPMSLFMHASGDLTRPVVAARLGATHGAFCVGCCWAFMAILVAVGTMDIAWMAVLAVVIFVEKVLPRGDAFATLTGGAFALVGAVLLVDPSTITALT